MMVLSWYMLMLPYKPKPVHRLAWVSVFRSPRQGFEQMQELDSGLFFMFLDWSQGLMVDFGDNFQEHVYFRIVSLPLSLRESLMWTGGWLETYLINNCETTARFLFRIYCASQLLDPHKNYNTWQTYSPSSFFSALRSFSWEMLELIDISNMMILAPGLNCYQRLLKFWIFIAQVLLPTRPYQAGFKLLLL